MGQLQYSSLIPMLHYFNPGHETAVLNASPYYTPAANQIKMQRDLAYLPAWYASPGDFIWGEEARPLSLFNLPLAINQTDLARNNKLLTGQSLSLWGVSPQSLHFFKQLNEHYQLGLEIPDWKDEYRTLSSRQTSRECLKELMEKLPEINPDILPEFYTRIEDIENFIQKSQFRQLVKSPYSSSGRGLLWLPPGKISGSSAQILQGMLRKQATVSIEKVLNKQLDFSMHFTAHPSGEISFCGYSIFSTNDKGAYTGSRIASQQYMINMLSSYIDPELLINVKNNLLTILKEKYTPVYQGSIGVDMLIYEDNGTHHLHPCLEINLRKSMGYLTLQLQQKYIHEDALGYFFVDYDSKKGNIFEKHLKMQKEHPLRFRNNRIESGYLSLCTVSGQTNYRAYIQIK